MPKILKEVKDRIISEAKTMLLEEGYEGVTIRKVAEKCNIATGTVYNYVKSKDMLIGFAMLEDWQKIIDSIKKGCEEAKTLEDGIRSIYDGIVLFHKKYDSIFTEFNIGGKTRKIFNTRHKSLVMQIKSIEKPIFEKFSIDYDENILTFVAENIITATNGAYDFEPFFDILKRIF